MADPGCTHEYFEVFDSYLPEAGIEYYYYDQLGSFYSDQPSDPDLWDLPRFVEEVEQVRQALGLDRTTSSCSAIPGAESSAWNTPCKYQQHLKGLIISNMMASGPAYNAYAHEVLMPAMDQEILAEIKAYEATGDTDNPRYMELLMEHHYVHHVLRMPAGEWPDPGQSRPAITSTRRSTCRCKAPASSDSAASSSNGTAPPIWTRSRSPPSSSAPSTTPWTRGIWNGWPRRSRTAAPVIALRQPHGHVRRLRHLLPPA